MLKSMERCGRPFRGDDEASQGTLEEDGEAFDSAPEELESEHWDTGSVRSARSGPTVRSHHHRTFTCHSLLGFGESPQAKLHQCVEGSPFKSNRISDDGLSWRPISPFANCQEADKQLHNNGCGNGVRGFAKQGGLSNGKKLETAVAEGSPKSPFKALFTSSPSLWQTTQEASGHQSQETDLLSQKLLGHSRVSSPDLSSQNEGSPLGSGKHRSAYTQSGYKALEAEVQSLRAENEELENALSAANSNNAQLGDLQPYVQFVEERYEELLELYRATEERNHELKEALEDEEAIREAMEEDIAIAKQGMIHEEQVRDLQWKLRKSEHEKQTLEMILKEAQEYRLNAVAEQKVVVVATEDHMIEELQQKIKELEDEATTLTYENVDQARQLARLAQELSEKDNEISELKAASLAHQTQVGICRLPEMKALEMDMAGDGLEDHPRGGSALDSRIAQLTEENEQSIAIIRSETAAEVERLTLELEERMAEAKEAQLLAEKTISDLQHQVESMRDELSEERSRMTEAKESGVLAEKTISDLQHQVESMQGELTEERSRMTQAKEARVLAEKTISDLQHQVESMQGELTDERSLRKHAESRVRELECQLKEEEVCLSKRQVQLGSGHGVLKAIDLLAAATDDSCMVSGQDRNEDGHISELLTELDELKFKVRDLTILNVKLVEETSLREATSSMQSMVQIGNERGVEEEGCAGEATIGQSNSSAPPGESVVVTAQLVEVEALGGAANARMKEYKCQEESETSGLVTTWNTLEDAEMMNLETQPRSLSQEETEANMTAEREDPLSSNQTMKESLEKFSVQVQRLENHIARDDLFSSNQTMKESLEKLFVEVQRLEKHTARLEMEVQRIALKTQEEVWKQAEEQNDALRTALKTQEVGRRQALEQNDALRATLGDLGKRLQEEVEKRSTAEEELNTCRQQLEEEVERARSLSRDLATVTEVLSVKERAVSQLEEDKAELKDAVRSLHLLMATTDAKIDNLEDALEEAKSRQEEVIQRSTTDKVINTDPQHPEQETEISGSSTMCVSASIGKLSDEVATLTEALSHKDKVICQLEEENMKLRKETCSMQLPKVTTTDTELQNTKRDSEASRSLTENMAELNTNVLNGSLQLGPLPMKTGAESLGSVPMSEAKAKTSIDEHNFVSTGNHNGGPMATEELTLNLLLTPTADPHTMELPQRNTDLHFRMREQPAGDDGFTGSKYLEPTRLEMESRIMQEALHKTGESGLHDLEEQLSSVRAAKDDALELVNELRSKLLAVEAEKECLQKTAEPLHVGKLAKQLELVEEERNDARAHAKELQTKLLSFKEKEKQASNETADSQLQVLKEQLISVSAEKDLALMLVKELQSKLVAVEAAEHESLQRSGESRMKMLEEELPLVKAERNVAATRAKELETKLLALEAKREEKPVQNLGECSQLQKRNDKPAFVSRETTDDLLIADGGSGSERQEIEEEKQEALQRSAELQPAASEKGLTLIKPEGGDDDPTRAQEFQTKLPTCDDVENDKISTKKTGESPPHQGLDSEFASVVEAASNDDAVMPNIMELQPKLLVIETQKGDDSLPGSEEAQVVNELVGNDATLVSNSKLCWEALETADCENRDALQLMTEAKIKALREELALAVAAIDGAMMHDKELELDASGAPSDNKGNRLLFVLKIVKELEAIVQMVSEERCGLVHSRGVESDVLILLSQNNEVVPKESEVELKKISDEELPLDNDMGADALMHGGGNSELKLESEEDKEEEVLQTMAGVQSLAADPGNGNGVVCTQEERMQERAAEENPHTLDEQLALAVFARVDAYDHKRDLELKLAAVEAEKEEALHKMDEAQRLAKELTGDALKRTKELESKLSALEGEKKAAMQEVEDARAQLAQLFELGKRITLHMSENELLQRRLAASEAEKEALENRIAEAEEDSRQASEEVSRLTIDLATVKHDADEEKRFNAAEIARINNMLGSAKKELSNLNDTKDGLEILNRELTSLKDDLSEKLASAEMEIAVSKQTTADLEDELSTLRSQLKEAAERERRAGEGEAKLSALQNEKAAIEERARKLTLDVDKLQSEVQSLAEQLSLSNNQREALSSKASDLAAHNEILTDKLRSIEAEALATKHDSNDAIQELERAVEALEEGLKLEGKAREELESKVIDLQAELADVNGREVSTALVLSNLRMEKENLVDQMREVESKNKSLVTTKEVLERERDEIREQLHRAEQTADDAKRELRKAEAAVEDMQEVQTVMQNRMVIQIRALEEEGQSLLAGKSRLEQELYKVQEELGQRTAKLQNDLEHLQKENQALSEANAALQQQAGAEARQSSRDMAELRQAVTVLQSELRRKVEILARIIQKTDEMLPSTNNASGDRAVINQSITLLESHLSQAEAGQEDVRVEHEIERMQALNQSLTIGSSAQGNDNNLRKELFRLVGVNEDLAQKERELTSKLIAQGVLEKEIERLKELCKALAVDTQELKELRDEYIGMKVRLAEVTSERDGLLQNMKQMKRTN